MVNALVPQADYKTAYVYVIADAALKINYPTFTFAPEACAEAGTYSMSLSPATLPTGFLHDKTNKRLLFSVLSGERATYTFEWIATSSGVETNTGAPVTAPLAFTVEVFTAACVVTSVTAPTDPVTYKYDLGVGGPLKKSPPQLTFTPPECASYATVTWSVTSDFVTVDAAGMLVIETADTTLFGD